MKLSGVVDAIEIIYIDQIIGWFKKFAKIIFFLRFFFTVTVKHEPY